MRNKVIFIYLLFVLALSISCKDYYGDTSDVGKSNTINKDTNNEITNIEDTKKKHQSRIPYPADVENTIRNERPIHYKKGEEGGTLYLGGYNANPKTFNPLIANENTSLDIIRRLFIPLMRYNEDTGEWFVYAGDYERAGNEKAYKKVFTDDGRILIKVFLSKGVQWSDGVPMTGEDWVWFWNNIYCNKYLFPAGYKSSHLKMDDGSIKRITAILIDNYTIEFEFPRIIAEPEMIINFSPMPKHIIKPIYNNSDGGSGILNIWSVDTPPENIITNGAWILKSYEPDQLITFEANKNYFEKDENGKNLPYLNKLVIVITPDRNALFLKFLSGDVDEYYVQNKDFKQVINLSQENDFSVWNGGLIPESEFISFNQNPEEDRLKDSPKLSWFTNRNFRRAISYLIDRETLVTQVHNGLAVPDDTYITKASAYYDPAVVFDNSYDPVVAMELLEGINIRDRDGDGFLEDKNENRIKFEIYTNAGNVEREKALGIMSNEFRAYGITVNPSPIEFNVLVSRLTTSYDWDCVLISMESGLIPLDENFYLSNGNMHLWNPLNPEPETSWERITDDLFLKAKYEPDFEKRKRIFNEMLAVYYDQLPIIPLTRKYAFKAVWNEWANVNWDIWTDIGGYNNLRVYKNE